MLRISHSAVAVPKLNDAILRYLYRRIRAMSFTIRLIVCVLLATATASLRAAAADMSTPLRMQQALILRVDGDLTFDAQGVPVDYRIKTTLPQKLADSLQRHVRSWRFEPVLVDGKPVTAQTEMRVTLAAQRANDDYRVTVDDVAFPQTHGQAADESYISKDPTTISYGSKRVVIPYPMAALAYGLEAKVIVDVKLTPEGRVDQAVAEQTTLFNVRGTPKDLGNVAEIFEHQALTSIKPWRFNVVVHVPNPTAENLTVRVPVHFSVVGTPGARDDRTGWQSEVRTPRRRAPWLPTGPTTGSVGVADVADGKLAPADRRFRLTAQVTGTTL